MDTNELKKWYTDHDIEKRAIEGFWKYYNNYREEWPNDFEKDFVYIDDRLIELKPKALQFSIIFEYADFINCILSIYYNDNDIGTYKAVFKLDGEYADDFLDLDDTVYINRLAFSLYKIIQIAENLLKKGLEPELVSKITELKLSFIYDIKNAL